MSGPDEVCHFLLSLANGGTATMRFRLALSTGDLTGNYGVPGPGQPYVGLHEGFSVANEAVNHGSALWLAWT